jgi:hypothetical protein
MSAPNTQPIFTFTPICNSLWFNPPISTDNRAFTSNQTIYTDESTYGSLITRITVIATAVVGIDVRRKTIYLGIKKTGSENAILYKTAIMEGVGGAVTNVVPYVEFTFGDLLNVDGLATNPGDIIVLASTISDGHGGASGDQLAVVVEGGTYDTV